MKGFRLGRHVKEGGDGQSKFMFQKGPSGCYVENELEGHESLWEMQQRAPERSRVVMGMGPHRCNAQDDICM